MIALAAAVLAGVTGCAGDGELESQRGTVRLISAAEPDEVLAEAQVILRREFGRVELDRKWSQLRAQPQEYAPGGAGAGDWRVGRSTVRRSATLTVTRRAADTLVRLRVDLERQDTRRHDAIPNQSYRLGDGPGYSPIERDAATTTAQNTVWTPIGRSVAMEMALLGELQERFAERAAAPERSEQDKQPP